MIEKKARQQKQDRPLGGQWVIWNYDWSLGPVISVINIWVALQASSKCYKSFNSLVDYCKFRIAKSLARVRKLEAWPRKPKFAVSESFSISKFAVLETFNVPYKRVTDQWTRAKTVQNTLKVYRNDFHSNLMKIFKETDSDRPTK